MSRVHPCRPWLAALAILLGVAACATNPVTGDQDFVLMSREREIALGEKTHKQIMQQYSAYEDEALQDYVSRLGQRLAAKSHRPELDYTFTVLDSDEVNAFALPGGYIYITRGIMAYFNSEAELAGVLGHELGHVTARHAVQQQSAATASNLLGGILLGAAGAGQGAAQLFQTVQLAAMRGYGREQELQADRLGAQYLARTGFDSSEMLDVVRILADQEEYARAQAKAEGREPTSYHGLFASHPDNDARLQEVIAAARKHEADDPRPDGHAAYLRRIDGMTFGPSADQGKVVDHRFLHLTLDAALTAPDGWTIANQRQQILFIAPDKAARMQVVLEPAKADRSPRELLRRQLDGADLARAQSFEAHGYPGYTGVAVQNTQQGRRPVRFTVIRKGDHAWYFAATSREPGAFDRFDGTFVDIAQSLQTLTAAQRRAAQPLHIDVQTAEAETNYAALADPLERVEDAAAQLRLLNGDWPDEAPSPGLIKTLE